MFFSAITKNLNWEILSKNLVTFKRWDENKDENFNIMEVHWKVWLLGGFTKKQYIRGDCLNRGWLGQFTDLIGSLGKKEGGVFEVSGYPNAHYDHLNT